jgi:Tfp pilus assembly protein PilF
MGTVSGFESIPLFKRISNAIVSYALYIKKLFWPTDLAVFYPISDIPIWQFLIALLFLVSVTIFVCRYFRRYPYLFVGWFWYLGTLVPVIGLIQVGSQSMADRYTYVPLIGIFIMMAWGLSQITTNKLCKNIILIMSITLIIVMFIITNVQIKYWRNTTSLFERALDVTKNNYIAHFGFGNELLKKNKIDEAISHFRASLILDPKNDHALVVYAWALHKKGENDEAITMLRQASRINPKSADAHHKLGFILFQVGQIDEAIIEYQKAIDLNNENPLLHNDLGIAFVNKGKINEAIKEFREVLRLNPGNAGTHNNLAMLLMRQDKNEEAILHFREAIRFSPAFANAHFHLARILKKEGFEEEAEHHYREAININPEYKNYKEDN